MKKTSYISLIRWFLIPFVLALFWVVFSVISVSYNNFTVLQYPHFFDLNNSFKNVRLLKGVKVSGQFIAKENNLGIVSLKFGEISKTEYENEDLLIFRIKEDSSKTWIYENTYRSGLANTNSYLPIGFNPISNSKGKKYIFEFESLYGNSSNSLLMSGSNILYVTKYQFSKNEILNSPSESIFFLKKKILTLFMNIDSLLSTFVFALPLVFYIFYVLTRHTQNKNLLKYNEIYQRFISSIYQSERKIDVGNSVVILLFINCTLITCTSLIRTPYSGIQLLCIGIWILTIYRLSLNSLLTYIFSFILICISTITIYFNSNSSIDNSTSLAYFFLCIAIIQDIIEYTLIYKKTLRS